MIYVGETKQELRKRMSAHRGNIMGQKENTHLVNHFNKAHNRRIIPKVRILETMDITATEAKRRTAEAKWTMALNTVHPWGLNTNIKGCGAITDMTDPAERRQCPWFRYKYERPLKRGQKTHKQKKKPEDRIIDANKAREFLETYKSLRWDMAGKYRALKTLKITEAQRTAEEALNKEGHEEFRIYQEVASYLLSIRKMETPKTTHPVYIPFLHVNEHSNVINPDRILRTRRLFTAECKKTDLTDTTFAYSYTQTLGGTALNYNKFLRTLDSTELTKILETPCKCGNPNYKKYIPDGYEHIITGDTDIIEDKWLRQLFQKGACFRQVQVNTPEAAAMTCIAALQIYIHRIVKKSHPHIANTIYANMHSEIGRLRQRQEQNTTSKIRPMCLQENTFKAMRRLQKQFIVTPVDKAQNNFAFICPKLYTVILNKELGVKMQQQDIVFEGNEVYTPTNLTEDELIDRHERATEKYTHKPLEKENKCMPKLWASPKFHKKPVKFRFIAGAKYASTKQLSVRLADILYMLKGHWERYTTKVGETKGYKLYWPIDNSGEVTQMLRRKKLPDNNKITIADFSTLYTSFEHDIIIANANAMIDILFKNAASKYIAMGKNAYYHNNEPRKDKSYTKEQVKQLLQFLVKNSFVTYAGQIFHQKSGIPMGANYSPVLANLCLAFMEFKYLKENPRTGLRLTHSVRYIDDILTIGSEILPLVAKDIYPASLPLSFDDTKDGTGHYLDLLIDRNTNTCNIYDKRKDFRFLVIRYTDAESNVPRGTGLSTMYSQAIRLARICSKKEDFISGLQEILAIMKEKGYTEEETTRTLMGIRTKYPCLLARHGLRTKREIHRLVSGNK